MQCFKEVASVRKGSRLILFRTESLYQMLADAGVAHDDENRTFGAHR